MSKEGHNLSLWGLSVFKFFKKRIINKKNQAFIFPYSTFQSNQMFLREVSLFNKKYSS